MLDFSREMNSKFMIENAQPLFEADELFMELHFVMENGNAYILGHITF